MEPRYPAEVREREFWPGLQVIPTMSAGASDGSFLRRDGIPTYGHSGFRFDRDDIREHGRDERLSVASFYQGTEYLYRLVKALAGDGVGGSHQAK